MGANGSGSKGRPVQAFGILAGQDSTNVAGSIKPNRGESGSHESLRSSLQYRPVPSASILAEAKPGDAGSLSLDTTLQGPFEFTDC
mmetsp:Transcript_34909/g.56324  ORF Transcript_34909/g.56324 Transcript_34909/m.56324 type:complete len:86 (-) Transcript_34909:569-826(-)